MTLETLTVTNVDDGYDFEIKPLQGVNETLEQPAFSLSKPGTSASNNILLGIQGQQGQIRIQFHLYNDGTDRSNGTAPTGVFDNDTVVTQAEQDEYLRNYIRPPKFDVRGSLTHDTGEFYQDDDIYIENVDIDKLQQDNPKWPRATLQMRRGGPDV